MGKRKTERNEPYTIEDHERYLAQQEEAREKRAIEAKEAALKLQARAKGAPRTWTPPTLTESGLPCANKSLRSKSLRRLARRQSGTREFARVSARRGMGGF